MTDPDEVESIGSRGVLELVCILGYLVSCRLLDNIWPTNCDPQRPFHEATRPLHISPTTAHVPQF